MFEKAVTKSVTERKLETKKQDVRVPHKGVGKKTPDFPLSKYHLSERGVFYRKIFHKKLMT